ncbi:MAG: DUF4296 domain-containing protein [Bacteroides sp.]|jgi:hypothetical protein|nr:DUF4296 domain-containing protein [Bacteroides sp.]MCI1683504.1 DUF4296 domain-containing protein [Bacteroides sp.]
MKERRQYQWSYIFLITFVLTGCEVKRPSAVMSDTQMEDVLYDYHIAKAMGEGVPYNESYKKELYIESAFKKHGITQADFDSSMVWFARNPDVMTDIYKKVNEKLKAERDNINHLISLRSNTPKESLPGDSIDIWSWRPIYSLTGAPLSNKISFVFPADSNFKDRDTLRWQARFRFYNKGSLNNRCNLVMSMQIRYKNDTTVSSLKKVYRAGMENLTLHSDTLGGIKEVKGFIYYSTEEPDNTLKLIIDRITLMRYHAIDTLYHSKHDSISKKEIQLPSSDSTKRDSAMKRTNPLNQERERIRNRREADHAPVLKKNLKMEKR